MGQLLGKGSKTIHLFAGAGGGILADLILGHRCICSVEIDPFCRAVLKKRTEEGFLPWFPIWDDVKTFDGKPWQGKADIVCGGFPCQDISSANTRKNGRKGIEGGKRSGLWSEFARIIGEVKPAIIFAENSPLLARRGLDIVLSDLAQMGFDARWAVLGARHVGGSHNRDRLWVVAWDKEKVTPTNTLGYKHNNVGISQMVNAIRLQEGKTQIRGKGGAAIELVVGNVAPHEWIPRGQRFNPRPLLVRMDDGMADGLDRLRAIGNGQCPHVAALAFRLLTQGLTRK